MVRKFLYLVAAIIVLIIAGAFVVRVYEKELTEIAFVPETEFVEQEALATSIYDDPSMWYANGSQKTGDPTLWQPEGAPGIEPRGPAAIFFVHPTSHITKDSWNAALDDEEVNSRARIFLRGLASPFASAGEVWAPRYRQAAIGAFLTQKPEGQEALNAAYQDVLQAFDHFIAEQPANRPIILAGHSQGARHLTYLLKDRVKNQPLAKRIVAAYLVGWPISIESDLPELGIPACSAANQTACVMTWQSFAEPADYSRIVEFYSATTGFNGESRKDTGILCTNPLNGGAARAAPKEENLGTLVPNIDLSQGELVAQSVPAKCDDNGFLLIGDPPKLGPYTIPGNNYHVYDIPLFWSNVRVDALRRTRAFLGK